MPEKSRTTIFAIISAERKRRLFHRLLDDGKTYGRWLEEQIDRYTRVKEIKRTQRKGA